MGFLRFISLQVFELVYLVILAFLPFVIAVREVTYLLLAISLIVLTVIIVRKMRARKMDIKGRVVLVTGCESGFGNAIARRLDDNGLTVIAGCLDDESEGALRLKENSKGHMHVIKLDITKEDDVERCVAAVKKICDGKGLYALINNPGMFKFGAVEICPFDDYRKIMEVNVFGTLRVTKKFLPMIRATKGRVLTLSSASGLLALPGQSAFCMASHSLEAMMDSLRLELQPFDVKVITVRPGHLAGTTGYLDENAMKTQATLMETDNSLSSETLAVYGEDYLKSQHKKLIDLSKSSASSLVNVIDTVQDALENKNPKAGYLIDGERQLLDFRNMIVRLQGILPKALSDRWLMKLF